MVTPTIVQWHKLTVTAGNKVVTVVMLALIWLLAQPLVKSGAKLGE